MQVQMPMHGFGQIEERNQEYVQARKIGRQEGDRVQMSGCQAAYVYRKRRGGVRELAHGTISGKVSRGRNSRPRHVKIKATKPIARTSWEVEADVKERG